MLEYKYTVFGKPIGNSSNYKGISKDLFENNIYIYKGYCYDVETVLFWCNSIYYNPEWGRWISPDSIEYLDPQSINGLNLYSYCNNNPIMYCDRDGKMPRWLENTLKIGGAVLITAALVVAASPLGVWGQVGVNALLSGGSYLINNYDSFNLDDFLFNTAIGDLAGFVGRDGWTKAGSTFCL